MKRIICIICILLLLLISCSTLKEIIEVPVETVRTEYIYNVRIDSIYSRDSIDRWVSGDTVFIYKERTKYRGLTRVDTVIKTDTIPKVIKVETIKQIEVNHINWYLRVLMWIGGVISLILIIYMIYKIKLKWM